MGSVGLGNTADLGAFLNKIYPEGLDLGRCQINQALGIFVADPATTFRAGMIVSKNSAGLVIPSAGDDFLGVAKWNHATSMVSAAVDEQVVLVDSSTAANLKHPTVTNVRVASAAKGTGTVYTLTTHYTVNASNGTVTKVAVGGAPADGATVFVTYTWAITEADLLQLQGKNFWNTSDEVSQADGRCTVITDAEILFTTQYDTTKVYALTGATSNLYASVAAPGLFTSDSASSAKFIGRVLQVPTAADPFLGLRLQKGTVAF